MSIIHAKAAYLTVANAEPDSNAPGGFVFHLTNDSEANLMSDSEAARIAESFIATVICQFQMITRVIEGILNKASATREQGPL